MYPQRTNFGCPLVPDFNFGNVYFPTSVVLPDGETFLLSYEPTPGYPGSVTGRLAQLTLPTGGNVSYSYSGSSGNGMNCATHMSTITRTLNDGRGNASQWTYVPAGVGNYTVTETDPASNTITYHFYSYLGRPAFQTEKTIADSHGNLLSTTITCYNGNNTSQSACIAPQNPIYNPTQTDVYTSLGSSAPSLVETIYDYNPYNAGTDGNVLTVKRWKVGTYPPSGSPLSTTTTTYANINGVTCGNALQYIVDHPCTSTTTNSSGVTVAQTKYTYNSAGHPTQTQNWVGGPTFLTSSAAYNTNGTIATSTDANGQVTSYAYNGASGCNNLLPTSTSTVVNSVTLTTSQTWNCFGGMVTSTTDANGQVTQYGYVDQNGVADPLLRLRSTTDPRGNTTLYTYSPTARPPTGETAMVFNSGASTVDKLTTYDGLGRPILQQTRRAPGSTNFDTVVTTYDVLGRVATTSLPCASTASVACSSPVNTTTTYDALDRPLQVTDGGGGYTQYSYSPSGSVLDTLVTVGPNPSGENLKKRQLESDNMGRLTSVCEVTGATGSGSCAQGVTATGYRTVYTYDALDRLIGVTQNAQGSPTQARSFVYDGLSRMTLEGNPESGTKTYTYDSFSSSYCASTSVGDLVATSEANGSVSCNYYDGLHRLSTAAAWTSGLNNGVCRRFRYDLTSNGVLGSPPSGVTVTDIAGQLMEAETDNCAWPITQSSMITDEWFSYSDRGEQTDVYESTPHSGGYYHVATTNWANGTMKTLAGYLASGSGFIPTVTYTPDGEGRWKSVTASSDPNPVSNTTYNAAGQITGVTYGSSDNDSFTYDPNTSRMKQYKFTLNGSSEISNLTWNANATLKTLAITDPFNSGNAQTCNHAYDDLSRVTSANCGTPWSQTFSYDPFGNITKSGSITWQPGYNQSTNHYTLAGTSYDASGNLTNDTFRTYAWDGFGKPIAIGTKTMTYDAQGRMAENLDAGVYNQFLYSPSGSLLARMNGQSAVSVRVPLPHSWALYGATNTFNHYEHLDWLGSSRLSSTQSRTMSSDIAYAPFGEPYASTSTTGVSFTGMRSDVVSASGGTTNGLFDFLARELPPTQSRWISPDPLGMGAADPSDPQSWNLYAYVNNSPLDATDPTGTDICPNGTTADVCVNDTFDNAGDSGRQVMRPLLNELQQAREAAMAALQSAADAARQWVTAPRNSTCMTVRVGAGAAGGMVVGGYIGSLGFAGGPAGFATTPAGAGTGSLIGGGVGWLSGMNNCMTGSGGGGGSSGGGGGGGKQGKFWKGLKNFRQNIKTNGLSGSARRFFQWDYTHGDVEVYNGQGQHLGSADPESGIMTKPAVPGRSLSL
jgi:RHS repeat-associated protein